MGKISCVRANPRSSLRKTKRSIATCWAGSARYLRCEPVLFRTLRDHFRTRTLAICTDCPQGSRSETRFARWARRRGSARTAGAPDRSDGVHTSPPTIQDQPWRLKRPSRGVRLQHLCVLPISTTTNTTPQYETNEHRMPWPCEDRPRSDLRLPHPRRLLRHRPLAPSSRRAGSNRRVDAGTNRRGQRQQGGAAACR